MNVDLINSALLDGNVVEAMHLLGASRDQKILTRVTQGTANSASIHFEFDWSLRTLPQEPGFISIRGPRQYGKSTWLNEQILKTVDEFKGGSAAYLNGDLVADKTELRERIEMLVHSLKPTAPVRRLFIDEISAVDDWAKGIKPLLDSGLLSDVLIVATGSKASDLRRGMERLPGRKGRLARTNYVFFPLSYRSFHAQALKFNPHLTDRDLVDLYLLSGGSPRAAAELLATGELPEYILETTRDWVYGELARAGRSRSYLISVLQAILERGGKPIGFTKLAREAGLANNTAASDYIDQLSDLFIIGPGFAWDSNRSRGNFRRPCKFHFVNLLAAFAWMPNAPRNITQLRNLSPDLRGSLYEWLAAQELFRRNTEFNSDFPEQSYYWLSDKHELDFVLSPSSFVEVKSGKTSSQDFSWFAQAYPKADLTVVSESQFEGTRMQGLTWSSWLLNKASPEK